MKMIKYKDGGAMKSLYNSKSLTKEMKQRIQKYMNSNSRYMEGGKVYELTVPQTFLELTPKQNGVSLGADKNGFFCYTHRARCKSYPTPEDIPVKAINFIESTG